MDEHPALDVILSWSADRQAFDVMMVYNAPGSIEDAPYLGEHPLRLDLDELEQLRGDVEAYGTRLGEMLFADQGRAMLDRAMIASKVSPVDLRLLVDPRAPVGYQAVWWEAIRRPGSAERLTTSDNIRFCRFLRNVGGRSPAPLTRQDQLSALVAVANPSDIGDFTAGLGRLAAVDVEAEVTRAREALGGMAVAVLPENGARTTRAGLLEALRKDRFHVLYLVCHGRIGADGRPELFLEDDDGDVDLVSGASLAHDLADLRQMPTIAALCSCQSGGPTADALTSTAQSLTATGPAIAEAGATVVLAMQGNVTMSTAAAFLQRFFQELNVDGLPGRAMASARSAVSERPDWFMPVLYSRLKRGSAWYRPRFGGREAQLFRNLHTRIRRTTSTPIIGSGVAGEDRVLPTRQRIATEWADVRQMPLSETSRRDLASVAQYVSVEDGGGYQLARDELDQLLRRDLKKEHQGALPGVDWQGEPLHDLVRLVGRQRRLDLGGDDCYSRLAALPLPVYVTTSWTFLLEDALCDAGREPVVRQFDWYRARKSAGVRPGEDDEDDELTEFDVDHPLVYHLFGTLEAERSLVLTEDDYFAWLREWMKQVDKGAGIPNYVKPRLMDSSLMFLGYAFDDWEFRMIVHAIKGFEGDMLRETTHVGVQLEPDTLRIEREAAQDYLESYLSLDNVNIYWQTCSTFLRELDESRPDDG